MNSDQRKTAWIGVKVEPSLKRRVRKAAEQEHRSMSGYVRKTLIEANDPAPRVEEDHK